MSYSTIPHIILGGGLAGLSAAYHLQAESGRYEIFEAAAQPGGVARSFTVQGFTFDHAIHVLFTKDPYASMLIQSLLGDNFVEHERRAAIYAHGRYIPYPYQANLWALPPEVRQENIEGLLAAGAARADGANFRNFEEWMFAAFGEGIAQNFLLPLNRKIWATPPRDMGFAWIADRVLLPEIETILASAEERSLASYGPNAMFWYPRQGGTAALTDALVRRVSPLHLQMPCVAIDPVRRTVYFANGEERHYCSLISTMPLPTLVAMLSGAPPPVAAAAARLRSNRVITLNLGIGREHISDRHWVYFPAEEFEFHRISYPMNFSETLAPSGASSMMLEFSESDTRKIERTGLLERTLAALRKHDLLRPDDEVLCSSMIEIDPAYVVQRPSHAADTEVVHDYLRGLGIYSCGRFGAWDYLNMDQAILSGKWAAEAVTARSLTESRHAHTSLAAHG